MAEFVPAYWVEVLALWEEYGIDDVDNAVGGFDVDDSYLGTINENGAINNLDGDVLSQ